VWCDAAAASGIAEADVDAMGVRFVDSRETRADALDCVVITGIVDPSTVEALLLLAVEDA
jgi:hypothetical protein